MKLLLDPNSVIASAKGWLYVFNRKGLTKIQADHLDEVHEKVKSYLNGVYEEEELISAVAAEKQAVLRKYLHAITEARALHRCTTVPWTPDLTIEESILDHHGHTLLFTLNGKKVLASLDGKQEFGHNQQLQYDARLVFLAPEQMNTEWNRLWQRPQHGPHLLYVLEESGPAPRESAMDRRRRQALWLIGSSRIDFWDTRTVRLYSLDSTTLSFKLRFEAGFRNKPAGKVIKPQFVTATGDEQIPLVIAKAEIPFYSYSVVGCGLEYSLLAEELEREFIARATLASKREASKKRSLTEFRYWQHSKEELRRTYVNPQETPAWPVAGSLLDLRVRALERFCWELPERHRTIHHGETDLLQLRWKHPQISYLAEVVQTRRPTLPGTLTTTACGLHVCQSGKHFAYSFIEGKAILDVLLSVTKDIFYTDSLRKIATRHECDFAGFMDRDELHKLVLRQNEVLDELKVNRQFTFIHLQRFGFSAWLGHFAHGN